MEDRYSRQELVIGKEAQEKIRNAKVAVVGVGALGCVSAELLCRSGIGQLTLIDRDVVELSNLQRQSLYNENDIGKPKAEAASHHLHRINSDVSITSRVEDLNPVNAKILEGHDLIIDGTDNFHTRFLINDVSKKMGVPWVYGGAIKNQGSVMTITSQSSCFRCVFKGSRTEETCDTVGVLNTIVVLTASIQVSEALKILLGKKPHEGLLQLDLHVPQISSLKTKKREKCLPCSGRFEYLSGKKEPKSVTYQCSNLYQFHKENLKLPSLKNKLSLLGGIKGGSSYLFFNELSVFSSGKILVKAESMKQAKSLIARYIGE